VVLGRREQICRRFGLHVICFSKKGHDKRRRQVASCLFPFPQLRKELAFSLLPAQYFDSDCPFLLFAGPYYSNTVNLGGFQTAPTFSFGCAKSQGGFFLGGVVNATGLLGFGPSALSAWAQLTRDSDVPPIFSMCLRRNPIFKSTLFL
jgi:hypothetical protein